MGFKYKVKGVSEEESKKLYLKYRRVLRKNNKDVSKTTIKLFLEIIYLYFDNPRKKLKKIFWPVIMANLMEKGSIYSVIKEYRKSKNLYSESYTCRMLNLLDDDTSLEISQIFRNILFKILKKKGFRNKGYVVAIDITVKPFYGDTNLLMASGSKKKSGTYYGVHYLTASIVEEGVRFNLMCIPINQLKVMEKEVEKIIKESKKHIRIKLLFLDRGFANKKYCRLFNKLRYKYCMPITKNNKLKELDKSILSQVNHNEDLSIIILDYTFYENSPREYQETVRMIALCEKKEIHYFVTNIYNFNITEYHGLVSIYRYRFGIETNYRVDNIFNPLTSSQSSCLRYILFQVSMIIQDLWTLINYLLHKEKMRQPREMYKRDSSIQGIIKSRIVNLNFVWRPVMSAVQFKRNLEKGLT